MPKPSKPKKVTPRSVRPANRNTSYHVAEETKAALNRVEAVRLKVLGWSLREIADKLNVSHTTIDEYVKHELELVSKSGSRNREKMREIETARLEKGIKAVLPYLEGEIGAIETTHDGKVITVEEYTATMKAADTLAKLSARLAALHGLDAPNKQELSGPGGGPIEMNVLTPERQAMLANRTRRLLEGLPKGARESTSGGEN